MTVAVRIANIPTIYNGVQFRSRLEAKWAAFFDLLGWHWHYEPLDLDGWIPDFLIEPFPGDFHPKSSEYYCAQCGHCHGKGMKHSDCCDHCIRKKSLLVEVKPILQRDAAITEKIERALGTSADKAVLYDDLNFDALLVGLFPRTICGTIMRIGWLMSDAWQGSVLIDINAEHDGSRYDISAEVQIFGGRLSGWRDGGHLPTSDPKNIDALWKRAGNAVQWSAR
jgi:hypothetical protein